MHGTTLLTTLLRCGLVVTALFAMGCGGAACPGRVEVATVTRTMSLESALFPESSVRELRADEYGTHIALLADSHVYASNGDDLPAMIGAAAFALLVHPREPRELRCATIGAGSTVEASALAALGCGEVHVFERRDELFANANHLGEWADRRLRPHGSDRPFAVVRQAPEGRYDVIVEAVGSTVLHRPHRLFSVERFTRLAALLAPDGVFVEHVQLYEIQGNTHRRMLRTLAEAFEQLVVFSPDALSSDSFVVASHAALGLNLARAEEWMSDPHTRKWTEGMNYRSPYDPLSRIMLTNREEVLRCADDAAPFTLADPLDPASMPQRPPSPPPAAWDSESFVREYDAALSVFLAQFDETFLGTFYSVGWPYGDACPNSPVNCASVRHQPRNTPLTEFPLSLFAHGHSSRSVAAVERGQTQGADMRVASGAIASLLHTQTAPSFDPLATLPPGLPSPLAAQLQSAWAARNGDPATTLSITRRTIAQVRPTPPELLLAAAMLALDAADEDVWDEAAILQRDHADWCDAHPPAWFTIGLAAHRDERDDEAVWAMARYQERLVPVAE